MKKVLFTFVLAVLVCLMLTFVASAKTVYLEEIPDELKTGESDTATHFVVFEDATYFTTNGSEIKNLNVDKMNEDMASCGIDSTLIGTTYLTRFNFPNTINEASITSIDFEAIKGLKYFSGVCGYIELPSTLTFVYNFRGHCSAIRCVDFGENSQISSIGAYFCEGASNLRLVKNFPQELTSIGTSAFSGCYYAFKGELYINATQIDSQAFNNAVAHVTKITFGPNVTTIGNQAFCVRMAELPAAAKPTDDKIQINTIEFQCDVSLASIDAGAFYFGGAWARSPYEHLETILLTHIDNEKNVKEGSVISDFTSGNVDVDFGNSTYTLTTIHNFEGSLITYDSFLEGGVTTCLRCGAASAEKLDPIFICEGYSVPLNGDVSITVSYRINSEALLAYEKANDVAIEFGLVVAIKSDLGESAPFDESGELSSNKILCAELNSTYTIFKTKITNIGESNKDTSIILCGYVIERNTTDEINKIVYLEETQKTADTLDGVSYSGISSKVA